MAGLSVSVLHRLEVSGSRLRIDPPEGEPGAPADQPLISLDQFPFHAGLTGHFIDPMYLSAELSVGPGIPRVLDEPLHIATSAQAILSRRGVQPPAPTAIFGGLLKNGQSEVGQRLHWGDSGGTLRWQQTTD